jgi:hypothetical protein
VHRTKSNLSDKQLGRIWGIINGQYNWEESMKVILIGCALLLVAAPAGAQDAVERSRPSQTALAETSTLFEGAWMATLTCPASPDGALGFSYQFSGSVKDGVFHGERGTAHEPGWLQLDGKIEVDGSASMIAEGVTNIRGYAVANAAKGTPYKHAVTAKFEAGTGHGSWITIRTCTFDFQKR